MVGGRILFIRSMVVVIRGRMFVSGSALSPILSCLEQKVLLVLKDATLCYYV